MTGVKAVESLGDMREEEIFFRDECGAIIAGPNLPLSFATWCYGGAAQKKRKIGGENLDLMLN